MIASRCQSVFFPVVAVEWQLSVWLTLQSELQSNQIKVSVHTHGKYFNHPGWRGKEPSSGRRTQQSKGTRLLWIDSFVIQKAVYLRKYFSPSFLGTDPAYTSPVLQMEWQETFSLSCSWRVCKWCPPCSRQVQIPTPGEDGRLWDPPSLAHGRQRGTSPYLPSSS